MKFLVPNYSCLQIMGLSLPDPRSLCPLSSTEFVEPPLEKNSWVRHCFIYCSRETEFPFSQHIPAVPPDISHTTRGWQVYIPSKSQYQGV